MKSILLLLVVAGVLVIVVTALRSRAKPGSAPFSTRAEPVEVEFSSVPDTPIGFGRKNSWIAVRTDDPHAVAETIGLVDQAVANWHTGFQAAYAYPSQYVFVTSPLEGWVLAVGRGLPDPSDPALLASWRTLLRSLSTEFGEAYFFATHRVSSYSAWSKYAAGTELRLFAFADESIYDLGSPLPEEAPFISRLPDPDSEEASDEGYWDRDDLWYPDEEDVLRFAGEWTFDPCSLDEREFPESTGIAGKLKLNV